MKSEKKQLCKIFNQHVKLILKLLKRLSPDNNEFRIIYTIFKVVSAVDVGKPHRVFHKNLGIYKEYIEHENEDFFLNKFVYTKSDKKIKLGRFFESLKSSWNSIDKTHKSIIWKETKQLVRISEQILAIDTKQTV